MLMTKSLHMDICSGGVQLGPTLWGRVDCGPPGSSASGIFQARMLEWGATSYSRESS